MAAVCCRILFLVIILLVNALDLISDWLFYNSANRIEKGLVYGPIDQTQVTGLLVFSIIGSVGFVVEFAVFLFELKKGEDFHGDLLLDVIAAIIIWFEDIPQVIISFSIALCREEPISIFQLTKAGLVLVGVAISLLSTIIRFCRKFDTKACVCGVRVCLILGIFLEGSFAAAIFALTQTEQGGNGEMAFKVPTTFIDEHLSDEKYIANVNLFARHTDRFDAWDVDSENQDWLNLCSLYDLKDKKVLSFKLTYEHTDVQFVNLGVWFADSLYSIPGVSWKLSGCYSINQKTSQVAVLNTSVCENEITSGNITQTFFMTFVFEAPDTGVFYRKRVFGEIFYNMKVLKNGQCSDVGPLENSPLTFHYFRINNVYNNNETAQFYQDESGVARFFRTDSNDITDVSEVWKTGWNKCSSSGSMSPVWDGSVEVECAI